MWNWNVGNRVKNVTQYILNVLEIIRITEQFS